MIKEFQYSFQDLEITFNEISELLGYDQDEIPDPFSEMIGMALNESPHLCQIKAAYKRVTKIHSIIENQQIVIDDQTMMPGKLAFKQLSKASSIAIFLCTAGDDISTRPNELINPGDHILNYIFDIIGSLAAEKAKEKLIKELETDMKQEGLNISDVYSPGHCEWNIAEQEKLFSLLPKNFCGVQLSKSLLMKPVKSVSGIIGIGNALSRKSNQCKTCSDTDCIYGRIKQQKKN